MKIKVGLPESAERGRGADKVDVIRSRKIGRIKCNHQTVKAML